MSEDPAAPRPKPLHETLHALESGEPQAGRDLLPLVYQELRRLAVARMQRLVPGQTLQPTALVHEAYLALVGDDDPGWNGRGHFFAAAALSMRRILVDHARYRTRRKRGGDHKRVELPDVDVFELSGEFPTEDLLTLDAALEAMQEAHPDKARLVMLRYFAGLSNEEVAEQMGVSVRTVERGWRFSKAWLVQRMGAGAREPDEA